MREALIPEDILANQLITTYQDLLETRSLPLPPSPRTVLDSYATNHFITAETLGRVGDEQLADIGRGVLSAHFESGLREQRIRKISDHLTNLIMQASEYKVQVSYAGPQPPKQRSPIHELRFNQNIGTYVDTDKQVRSVTGQISPISWTSINNGILYIDAHRKRYSVNMLGNPNIQLQFSH
ncbi:MAG: hypothetical protein ABI220_03430 [Candidatus Saccharimonadales bacterium]